MAVHKIAEEEIRRPLRLIASAEDDPRHDPGDRQGQTPTKTEADPQMLVQAMGTITALAKIISVRLVLLLTGLGAIGLASAAFIRPSWPAVLAMLIYDLTVFLPVILLESGMLAKRG